MFKADNLERATAGEERAGSASRHIVLVVDDEAANLQAIGATLDDLVEVVAFRQADQALAWLDTGPEPLPSAVVCDYRMSGMDGVELLTCLKRRLPDARRILLTGYVDIDAVIDSINHAGIWRFMVKPWDREDLRLTVARALESWELKRRLDLHLETLERTVAERTRELEDRNQALKQALAEIHRVSRTDALTGLRNRRYLEDTIDADLALARRQLATVTGQNPGDLLFFMVDIDRFKPINDRLGHAFGDELLRQFARRLLSCFRNSDVVMRWGGEEFLVLARFVDRRSAAELAERICRAVDSEPFGSDECPLAMSCSVGFACWPYRPAEAGHWTELVELADLLMYRAKRAGGNRWQGAGDAGDEPPLAQRLATLRQPAAAESEFAPPQSTALRDRAAWHRQDDHA